MWGFGLKNRKIQKVEGASVDRSGRWLVGLHHNRGALGRSHGATDAARYVLACVDVDVARTQKANMLMQFIVRTYGK